MRDLNQMYYVAVVIELIIMQSMYEYYYMHFCYAL